MHAYHSNPQKEEAGGLYTPVQARLQWETVSKMGWVNKEKKQRGNRNEGKIGSNKRREKGKGNMKFPPTQSWRSIERMGMGGEEEKEEEEEEVSYR